MTTFPSACLIVLDGWGIAPHGPGNAVSLASTPVFDELWAKYPHSQLTTWGPEVGLPERQMGNSEVGHLNLGAGAIVKQDLTRIRSWYSRRPEPIVRCPTSELPIWPAGRPTASPEASSLVCG